MGPCASKHRHQFSSIEDLEARLLEGGDDDYQSADKRGGGCCFCCGGGGAKKKTSDFDEDGLNENHEAIIDHRREISADEFQTIASGWNTDGVGTGQSLSDERTPVDLNQRPLPASIANTCFIFTVESRRGN